MPVAGSQLSSTAKKMTSTTASQKVGTEMPNTASAVTKAIDDATLTDRGDGAEDQREDEGQYHRDQRHHDGIGEGAQDFGEHGQVGGDGRAEIAADHPAQPHEVLDVDRLIEAVEGAQGLDLLGRGVRAHQALDRIAGRDAGRAQNR